MTTKEQAERIINELRKQGFTDDELIQAVMNVFQKLKGEK